MKKTCILITLLWLFTVSNTQAKVYIDLAAPAVKKLPIAVQEFKDLGSPVRSPEDAEIIKNIKNELASALRSDLVFSNLFKIIEKEAFLEDPMKAGLTKEETDFRDWRTIGADTLVKGAFLVEGGRLTVEVRYYDCVKEEQIFGKKYIGNAKNPRKLVHYFADQIYQELTGRKGIFTSRLLFVSNKTGTKEVYMSDYDGRNAIQITRNKAINLSPQWSPDGKKIIYTSYKKGWPCLHMLDLTTGKETVVSEKPGINIGGRFSPDGSQVALTLSIDKSSELYLVNIATGENKRLTDNFGIDVSPAWSPDGKKIAFISDISGNPHIFMLDLGTGNLKRLTYSGKYNSSPAWSPDGKLIAFSRSDNGKFNIWVMQPDGGNMVQLTSEGDNRSPSWSPDGRFLIFSSTVRGVSSLQIIRADGSGRFKLDTGMGNEKSPVWSPFMQ